MEMTSFGIGLLVGLAAGWLAARWSRSRSVLPAVESPELVALRERLQAREAQISEMRAAAEVERAAAARLRDALQAEAERRSAAEERAAQAASLQQQLEGKEAALYELQQQVTAMRAAQAELQTRLEETRKSAEERLAAFHQAQEQFTQVFKALSAEALEKNNQSFLELARATLERFQETAKVDLEHRQKAIDEVVKPLKESLAKVDTQIQELEKTRAGAYAALNEQLKSLATTQSRLQAETANLVRALRAPATRGRWGEMHLRRVVEMAGMVEYCDFEQQVSIDSEEGRLRPDMLIRLPNGRLVVVDSKVSLSAYLDALEAPDEQTRALKLKEHAAQVKAHLARLGSKTYWNQFPTTPEFVLAFLPGETFFGAALEQDPSLIEYGVEQKVLLATPTTLIALLKAVAYGWRQEKMTENARQISELGRQLYERMGVLAGHLDDLRRNLERAVESYNKAAASFESRVLVSTRRFRELGAAGGEEIKTLEPVEKAFRAFQAPGTAALPAPEEED